MRIIGGTLRKKKLLSPGKLTIRPTPDRVREAMFNTLGPKVLDSLFLDLFSGTGAVGIEAVSRGAAAVTFVEKDHRASLLLKRNLDLCDVSEVKGRLIQSDALSCVSRLFSEKRLFDYLFLDPPYHTDLAERLVLALNTSPILKSSGKIIVEHYFKKELPEQTGEFTLCRKMRYGETVLSYYASTG